MTSAHAGVANSVQKITQIKKQEPCFSEVLFAYFHEKGLSQKDLLRLKKKIKAAPFLPTLYLGYDHAFREREDMSQTDNVSISSGVVTVGPTDNDYNYYDYYGQTFRARAVWRLDEIVFNRNVFLYEKEKRELIKLQKDLADDLYKTYEERSLYLIKYLQSKGRSSKKTVLLYAKYLSMTEKLNALTGRRFEKKWWKESKNKKNTSLPVGR